MSGSNVLRPLGIGDLASMDRFVAEDEIRARVQTVAIGDDLILCRVLGHPKMFLHVRDLGFCAHVMLDGYWEGWLTIFMSRYLKPGMTCLDIGANFGYYSILMGLAAGPLGRVISIEPNPSVVSVLKRSLELNGLTSRTIVHQVAAAADRGACHLYVPSSEPKNASLVNGAYADARGQTVEVDKVTVDELTANLDRLDFIKIDVEGAEEEVIEGLRGTMERFKPAIVLEFNAARYRNPMGFLDRLIAIYGPPRIINFYADAVEVTIDDLIEKDVADDKLLFFSKE